jgi:hypothetical protein
MSLRVPSSGSSTDPDEARTNNITSINTTSNTTSSTTGDNQAILE